MDVPYSRKENQRIIREESKKPTGTQSLKKAKNDLLMGRSVCKIVIGCKAEIKED